MTLLVVMEERPGPQIWTRLVTVGDVNRGCGGVDSLLSVPARRGPSGDSAPAGSQISPSAMRSYLRRVRAC